MENCICNPIQFMGWEAWELTNGIIRLVAVPQIGGRIMAYDLGDLPFLFVDAKLAGKLFSVEENQGDGSLAAWKNYGGDKTWTSPQGWDNDEQWHGPPDPVLDTGIFTQEHGCEPQHAWIRMSSPKDAKTGIQITREFHLHTGSSRIDVRLTFENISQRKICWSIWNVIQLDASCISPNGTFSYDKKCSVTTKRNPTSRFAQGYYVMFGDEDNPQWAVDTKQGIFCGKYLWEIGKVGVDSDGGWAAFSNESKKVAFTASFHHFPDEEYPDKGVGVEFWTVGKGKVANLDYEKEPVYLMEVELLSPLYNLMPTEKKDFQISYGVCQLDGFVIDANTFGCFVQPLKITRIGNEIKLTAKIGVYDVGELIAQCIDVNGRNLYQFPIKQVTPQEAVTLDHTLAVPSNTHGIMLLVRSKITGEEKLLAKTYL